MPGDRYNDGGSYELSMLMGSNFADGRGNATLFVGYRETEALLQSERDYSACTLGSSAAGFNCGGSGTAPGRFYNADLTRRQLRSTRPTTRSTPFVTARTPTTSVR